MKIKNLKWVPFAFFAIAIGFYPLIYYVVDMRNNGLLQTKPKELINNTLWHTVFYIHITFGGIAMLTGWTQFSQRLRDKYMAAHRLVGKIYILAVLISGSAGLFVAFFASGGIVSVMGFGILALLWLITVIKAYTTILKRDVIKHEYWMIRNYALTFAAVTLRIWLPLMIIFVFRGDFFPSYRIVSWLCWVPNIIIAEIIVRKRKEAKNFTLPFSNS